MLDRTGQRTDDDEVADLKRLVHCDGQRGKHVAQNVLHRQRDRDTADPEAGDERGDIDPDVRQHRHDHRGPQQYFRAPQTQRGQRTALKGAASVVTHEVALQRQRDRPVRPQPDL